MINIIGRLFSRATQFGFRDFHEICSIENYWKFYRDTDCRLKRRHQCRFLKIVSSKWSAAVYCRGVSNEWNFADDFRNLVLKFEIRLWNFKFTLKCESYFEMWNLTALKPIVKPSLISRSEWPVMPYTYSFLQI